MFKTWTASDEDPETLARAVEGHLNEFAEEVVSVGYAVSANVHHVLVVYRPVEVSRDGPIEAALSIVEEIVELAQT